MDLHIFDSLARSLATEGSRRSLLRRAFGSMVAAPTGLVGVSAAQADGKDKDKDRDKDRNKDKENNRGDSPDDGQIVVSAPGGVTGAEANQTVVQTNNQVCAGDCTQTNQQVVDTSVNQSVIAGSAELFDRPPTYWVDMRCSFDAPAYRTTCTGTGRGQDGAPLVHKIGLPRDGFCAVVIDEESRPEKRETIRRTVPLATGGEANAGTGGVANADASGGSVIVGDVRGNNDIAIDASGGTANADASGGDNNVAIAGGGRTTEEVIEQVVEPSSVTLTLEGNVAPGKATTYWLETDAGRRPATGPALVQVADDSSDTGAIIVETWDCGIGQPQPAFDWFGQCTTPAAMTFGLYPESGGTPLATQDADAQGRVRFANLPPGTYQVRPEGKAWCYAESDRVDANGNVIVEAQTESHVWSFVCSGGGS